MLGADGGAPRPCKIKASPGSALRSGRRRRRMLPACRQPVRCPGRGGRGALLGRAGRAFVPVRRVARAGRGARARRGAGRSAAPGAALCGRVRRAQARVEGGACAELHGPHAARRRGPLAAGGARARCSTPARPRAGGGCSSDAVRARRQVTLHLDEPAPSGPSGTDHQRRLAALAAAVARFETEVAPGIAAAPPASLDDLRLRMPALRPVGCWWSGCAPRLFKSPPLLCPRARTAKPRRAARAQVRQPGRHIGGGPAAAAVLRLQHRALLLAGVPRGGLARGPQGRLPARAQARLTGAAARRPPGARAQGGVACRPMHEPAAASRVAAQRAPARGSAAARRAQAPAWSAARALRARPLPAGAMRSSLVDVSFAPLWRGARRDCAPLRRLARALDAPRCRLGGGPGHPLEGRVLLTVPGMSRRLWAGPGQTCVHFCEAGSRRSLTCKRHARGTCSGAWRRRRNSLVQRMQDDWCSVTSANQGRHRHARRAKAAGTSTQAPGSGGESARHAPHVQGSAPG